ncbi:hypothetical protein RGU12_15450 [Fredinandcohnia sp. QZ13]|uniref:hypothetical protein n=1 Tax=Fredinandcohnia sp. QZ13 TaxID=3073144 RepID=UPI0028534FF6|nr:hypothetical protein [Fredinandcohnia sp. QZ13]MDR4888904.1 hypothetical protein [Fredinandcohnia sp. QZ13]
MYTKTCPKCSQPSFCSSKYGEWDCPICQADLSSLRARDAGDVFHTTLHKKYTTTHLSESHTAFETYI